MYAPTMKQIASRWALFDTMFHSYTLAIFDSVISIARNTLTDTLAFGIPEALIANGWATVVLYALSVPLVVLVINAAQRLIRHTVASLEP